MKEKINNTRRDCVKSLGLLPLMVLFGPNRTLASTANTLEEKKKIELLANFFINEDMDGLRASSKMNKVDYLKITQEQAWDRLFIIDDYLIKKISQHNSTYKVSINYKLIGILEDGNYTALKRKNRPPQTYSGELNITRSQNDFTIESPDYPPMISRKKAIILLKKQIISNKKNNQYNRLKNNKLILKIITSN